MDEELVDYGRFSSNGADIAVGDNGAPPPPEPAKTKLETWAQRYEGK